MKPSQVFRRLGLPGNLISLIRKGQLEAEIARAYERYDSLCARMEAFEAERPEVARLLPWYDAREDWKAAGMPRPEWYEVLTLFNGEQPFWAREAHLEWPRPPHSAARHRVQTRMAKRRYDQRKRDAKRASEGTLE